MAQVPLSELGELLGKFHDVGVSQASKHDVLDLVQLIDDGLVDAFVGMPKEVGPPRADAIQIRLVLI